MIQTKIKQMDQALNEAIRMAKEKRTPQLLSVTEEIGYKDPFIFFEKAKQIKGRRTFWASSMDNFYLVGAGEAYDLKFSNNRFKQIEKQWKSILENAIISNPYQVCGTGPIAIGGFAFDVERRKTELWKHFQGSQFRVPAYLLTIVNNKCYLTINTIVHKEDQRSDIQRKLDRNKEYLLQNNEELSGTPVIKQKMEIGTDYWKNTIKRAIDEIKQGNVSKIVLAREMRVSFENKANIAPILKRLAKTQTNSYIFAFENGEDCFVGATPERLVKVENKQLLSTCIASTAPRGKTKEEDIQIGYHLLHDSKNREEHECVVKVIRQAVEEFCEEIMIPRKPVVYPLRNLQHLYTPVRGVLKEAYSIIDVVKHLHPTPALGGFPKSASLSFIRKYEKLDRGWYGAPIGWLDAYQNGEFAVAIRSALVQSKEASLFAGCGVVKDSDPEAEYRETAIKFTPMLSVLGE